MIKVGIYGYGNLAKGVEIGLQKSTDIELIAVFTRRNPTDVRILSKDVPVVSTRDVLSYVGKIDVMIMCGGSATDLPVNTPELGKYFNVIDSYDTHGLIKSHYENVNEATINSNHVGIISIGWDPGLFSYNRLLADAIFNDGKVYSFWGDGVSQGHSDAIRRIEGVKLAIQYTRPLQSAIEAVRSGTNPNLSARQKHLRECYVVLKDGYDSKTIRQQIITMPNYFADYDTVVNFISEEEFLAKHNKMPHGGVVIASSTNNNHHQLIEYRLKLDSNPEFTALVLIAYTRACYRLWCEKQYGAKTVFDIAPAYLTSKNKEELYELL